MSESALSSLSLDTPPAEVLEVLEAAGLPQQILELLRLRAELDMHPLLVLQQLQTGGARQEEQRRDRMLESFDLEGIARYIADKECKQVVVMCGAGISTSAGIPDFRTPGTGLYDNLQRFNLPRPEAVFDVEFFMEHPSAFYELAKEMWPGNFKPTPAHYFIKLLHDKGILTRCYTQNIDSLECLTGLPKDKVVAAHGNFDAAHVVRAEDDDSPEVEVPIEELKAAVDKGEEGWEALRRDKGGLVKPKIVFFGEGLPQRFWELRDDDLRDCDLLIVLGTSLVVGPFNGLVGLAWPTAPRLLINRDPAGTCNELTGGFRFHKTDEGDNWRDAFHQGDCDSGCRALALALGWGQDLEALIESEGSARVDCAPWARL